MAAQDAFNPGQEAASVTASPNIQTVQAQFDPNGSANKLIQALGAESTQRGLAGLQEAHNQKKLQEQSMKISGYSQQWAQDHESGAVSQAQLRERFPEMVPVIAARVAEDVGKNQGALLVAKDLEFLNGNDDIRLDSARRAQYIKESKARIFTATGGGKENEFYSSGISSAVDRAYQQEDMKWQGQTAAYQQEVQKTAFAADVTHALYSDNFPAALAELDTNRSQSGSLNNVERNKVIVDTVAQRAFLSGDVTLLQQIPQKYLSTASKAQLEHAGIAIQDQQMKQARWGIEMTNRKREEQARGDTISALDLMLKGGMPNINDYKGNPESIRSVQAVMSSAIYPAHTSEAAASKFEHDLMAASFSGSIGTLPELQEKVLSLPGVNIAEKQAIYKKLPDLLKGTVLMNDEAVQSAYRDNIAIAIPNLQNGISAEMASFLQGKNLGGDARRMYENSITRDVLSFYDQNKQLPGPFEKQTIIKSAISETRDFVERSTKITAATPQASPAAKPVATAPSAQAKPSASPKPTSTKSLVDQEIERRMKAAK